MSEPTLDQRTIQVLMNLYANATRFGHTIISKKLADTQLLQLIQIFKLNI